jgi:26S proteasome regulatory subunit T5
MTTLEDKAIWDQAEADDAEDLGQEILRANTDEIVNRTKLLENDIKVMRSELSRLNYEHEAQQEKIKDNKEKIKLNKQLPYLVANIVEVHNYHQLAHLSILYMNPHPLECWCMCLLC